MVDVLVVAHVVLFLFALFGLFLCDSVFVARPAVELGLETSPRLVMHDNASFFRCSQASYFRLFFLTAGVL